MKKLISVNLARVQEILEGEGIALGPLREPFLLWILYFVQYYTKRIFQKHRGKII